MVNENSNSNGSNKQYDLASLWSLFFSNRNKKEYDLASLWRFLRGARGRSQEEIVKQFIVYTVHADPVADQRCLPGTEKALVVFNEGDFLFEEKLLDASARARWPTEFSRDVGIAGYCFSQQAVGR